MIKNTLYYKLFYSRYSGPFQNYLKFNYYKETFHFGNYIGTLTWLANKKGSFDITDWSISSNIILNMKPGIKNCNSFGKLQERLILINPLSVTERFHLEKKSQPIKLNLDYSLNWNGEEINFDDLESPLKYQINYSNKITITSIEKIINFKN